MTPVKPKHEAFARAHVRNANGSAAVRSAGYGHANASSQAAELLKSDDIAERIGELDAEIEAERREAPIGFVHKLEPVYDAALETGDHDTVLQTVELRARITGLVQAAPPYARAPAERRRRTRNRGTKRFWN